MPIPEIIIIIWIIIVLIVWRYVRRKKPGLIGLDKNLNKQKLDGVKFSKCPECGNGYLEPKFKWWQYTLFISTPIGFLLIGKPYEYYCNSCTYVKDGSDKKGFLTRLSLSHKLTKPFFIGIGVNFAICIILVLIFMNFIK
jgi:hypothetical protein